jgi:hypothetical protein
MSDQESTPASSHGAGGEPEPSGDDREAAMMKEVLREQEEHREGGVEPGLDDADTDPGPGDQGS